MQDLFKNPGIKATEDEGSFAMYEEAFRNFVSSHENCLRYEDDEEKIALTYDSYDSQRDMKFQLDIWRVNGGRKRREMEGPHPHTILVKRQLRV